MKTRQSEAWTAALLLAIAFASAPARGDDEIVVKIGEIAYTSGGTGEESRERLSAIAGDFNLKLVLALESGAYLSAVQIDISDTTGKMMFQTKTDGPILLARLPAGTYTVAATLGEKRLERKMTVAYPGQKVLHFRWATEP